MIKAFKFFEGQSEKRRAFTDFLGALNEDLDNNHVPHRRRHGISMRHWNLLPQDIKESTEEEMLIYIQGWETPRNRVVMNPHTDNFRLGNIWTRGFEDRQRRNTNPYVEQVREYITDIIHNQPQHHGFYVGVHNTQLILEYEGDMDIESVRAMTHDLRYRYMNYVSINEQVIGFMQDYLNEHLSGISILRLA